MEYKELIRIVEDKRNRLYRSFKESIISKKTFIEYLNKYDELLLDLYTKYENYLTINYK